MFQSNHRHFEMVNLVVICYFIMLFIVSLVFQIFLLIPSLRPLESVLNLNMYADEFIERSSLVI